MNRAIQSIYSPGSTFKVPVAMAALESGAITPQTTFHCPGYFTYGNRSYKCWEESGHGVMDVRNAIRMSCNVFFYNVGARMGPQNLGDWMIRLGYGQKTGINLENENPGLVPTDAWQSRVTKGIQKKLAQGEGVNMAIGQGALNITVIQMALLYASVANEGTLYKPRLVSRIEDVHGNLIKDFPPEARLQLPVQKQWIGLVKQGMIDVVKNGTGQRAQVPGVTIAGKTGSAQFKGVDRNTGSVVSKTRTWFDSFAPAESPRYAMAVLVEGGVSGGTTAAPIAQKIYEEIFQLEKRREAGKEPTVKPAIAVSPAEIPGEIGGEFMEAQPLSPEELESIERSTDEEEQDVPQND
jgi:penicillin-binding protein 2